MTLLVRLALHVTSPTEMGHEPVTDVVIARRLAEAAAEIPANASVPRLALADIAYPASEDELKALGGFAVLLVTAVARDPAELPIDRVEAQIGTAVAKLVLVATRRAEITDPGLAAALGRWRQDAAYLPPMFTTVSRTKVVVFLAAGQRPLMVLDGPAPPSADGPLAGVNLDFDPSEPRLETLRAFIDRELPALHGAELPPGR